MYIMKTHNKAKADALLNSHWLIHDGIKTDVTITNLCRVFNDATDSVGKVSDTVTESTEFCLLCVGTDSSHCISQRLPTNQTNKLLTKNHIRCQMSSSTTNNAFNFCLNRQIMREITAV